MLEGYQPQAAFQVTQFCPFCLLGWPVYSGSAQGDIKLDCSILPTPGCKLHLRVLHGSYLVLPLPSPVPERPGPVYNNNFSKFEY